MQGGCRLNKMPGGVKRRLEAGAETRVVRGAGWSRGGESVPCVLGVACAACVAGVADVASRWGGRWCSTEHAGCRGATGERTHNDGGGNRKRQLSEADRMEREAAAGGGVGGGWCRGGEVGGGGEGGLKVEAAEE